MNLLAIDTSTDRPIVALARDLGEPIAADPGPGPRHGRALVPAIAGLLAEAGVDPRRLDAVAVGIGPGSFTGLRIGVIAAKAIAYAAGCRLASLSSLEAIARGAPPEALRIAVATDAHRGELFVADFARERPGSPPARRSPDRIEPIGPWAAGLPADALVLCSAPDRLAGHLDPSRIGPPDLSRPGPLALLDLTREAIDAGRLADPWFLEPSYLRRSAAEEKRDAPFS